MWVARTQNSEVRTKMSPFAAVVVKAIGGAGVAALLSVGAVSVSAATPTPKPTASAGTTTSTSTDRHADRRAVRRAVIEAEAEVLGTTPQALVKDLKAGQKVS